jgi:hypothetical protein
MRFFRKSLPEDNADVMRDDLTAAFRIAHAASAKGITVEDLAVGTSQSKLYDKLDISDEDKAVLRRATVLILTHEAEAKALMEVELEKHIAKLLAEEKKELTHAELKTLEALPDDLQKALTSTPEGLCKSFREKRAKALESDCACLLCETIREAEQAIQIPANNNPNFN